MKPKGRAPGGGFVPSKRPAGSAFERTSNAVKGLSPMSFSVLPLLLVNRDISAEARRALVENRLQDAAQLLMRQYALSCLEVSHLLDISVC